MNKTQTKINRTAFLILISLFAITAAFAQSIVPNQTIAAKVDEYMNAAVKVDDFSGSVLVARDGKPIFNKSYRIFERRRSL